MYSQINKTELILDTCQAKARPEESVHSSNTVCTWKYKIKVISMIYPRSIYKNVKLPNKNTLAK